MDFFRRNLVDEAHYHVTTLWDTMANHAHYAINRVPTLRNRADVTSDLVSLTGYVVALAPQWSVLPTVHSG